MSSDDKKSVNNSADAQKDSQSKGNAKVEELVGLPALEGFSSPRLDAPACVHSACPLPLFLELI